ncbi:hypothetical protein N7461_007560 [Penicillium sp. DV-2018c]|nr:hypothetical protein N7461_007560 [Penicillium sp. DV-2018c]
MMSAEIQLYDHSGRTHAGEVSRRADRKGDALPPPGSQNAVKEVFNNNHGRRRRRIAPGGGGLNSDSDSDRDDRKEERDPEEQTHSIRPATRLEAHPGDPSTNYRGTTMYNIQPRPRLRMAPDQTSRQTWCMQQLLWFLKEQIELVVGESNEVSTENDLPRLTPAGFSPSLVNADTKGILLQYVDERNERISKSFSRSERHTCGKRLSPRHGLPGSLCCVDAVDALPEELVRRIYWDVLPQCSLYVETADPVPEYAAELFRCAKKHRVFKVILDGYRPVYAEPLGELDLGALDGRGQDVFCPVWTAKTPRTPVTGGVTNEARPS